MSTAPPARAEHADLVLREDADGIARLTLNRPAARNGGHYSGSSPFAPPARPRFQPYHGRRLPPATQRRPPPPAVSV